MKFSLRKAKKQLLLAGYAEFVIDFSISVIRDGAERSDLIELLVTAPYNLTLEQANLLLDNLYLANGGEYRDTKRDTKYYAIWLGLFMYLCGVGLFLVTKSNSETFSALRLTKAAVYVSLCFVLGTISLVTGLTRIFLSKK